jgi:hypothetical protein
MSASIPKFTGTDAVTSWYIQAGSIIGRTVWGRLLAMVGSAINTMFESGEDLKAPSVVLESATHL